MTELKNYLFELCSESAPSGREELLCSLERLVRPYADECCRDGAGNLIAVKKCGVPGAGRLLLDAHADEVGLVVTDVDERGFIHFANHAGIDDKILPASTVTVLSSHTLIGVVSSIPPHLDKGGKEKKVIKAKDLVIDVGLDADSARKAVKVGDFIALRSSCTELRNGLVLGKSFDNRAGCAVLVKVLSLLGSIRPRRDLYFCFSASEEFNGAGASSAAFLTEPDEALVLDTTFAVSPYTPASRGKKLGGGCAIGISPILNTHMTESLIGAARSRGLPYQTEVIAGRTGTNADNIARSRAGVPTALISLPLRYMHSAGEIVSLSDLETAVLLVMGFIEYRAGGKR